MGCGCCISIEAAGLYWIAAAGFKSDAIVDNGVNPSSSLTLLFLVNGLRVSPKYLSN